MLPVPDHDLDATAQAIVAFLEREGAGGHRHAGGRTLLEHLRRTYWIVRRWGQPEWLAHAALLHSVYGTESHREALVTSDRRAEVAEVAGERAERIAYLFCTTPRGPLLAGTHLWARSLPLRLVGRPGQAIAGEAIGARGPSRDELDALVLLHVANIAEQAHAADGRPGRWLARIGSMARLLERSDSLSPPPFLAALASFSGDEEARARQAYLAAPDAGALSLVASLCPVLPEPCAWLACLSADPELRRSWAALARARLAAFGTVWDRRLEYEEWLALIDALERGAHTSVTTAHHPRDLLDAVREPPPPSAGTDGRARFRRYVESLAGSDGGLGAIYPDLPSSPWHDPDGIPLVRYLESHFEEIRDELLALDGGSFHRESERIGRTGDWDVAFLYERGRRNDEISAACPVTTRGIERHAVIRTLAGLVYVSRMRAGTHIAAHRGPTNLRLRCHLALTVPEGDCAIRVGAETRHWVEGKCLVFDYRFDHEAWNHTGQDRIVLVVDLWHPGLAAAEISLLEGLHGYAAGHGRRLSRYWAANSAARGD